MTTDKDALLRECKELLNDVCHADVRPVPRICHMVDRITAALAEPQGDGWIKCSERLPMLARSKENGFIEVDVVLTRPNHPRQCVRGYYLHELSEWRISGSPSNWTDSVTHWRPLPPLPRSE